MAIRAAQSSHYSSFGIGVHRKHAAKRDFHQENATFKRSQKVYVNSETALRPALSSSRLLATVYWLLATGCLSGAAPHAGKAGPRAETILQREQCKSPLSRLL